MQRQQAKTKRPHLLVRLKKERKKIFQLAKVEETILCERLKKRNFECACVEVCLVKKNLKKLLLLRLIEFFVFTFSLVGISDGK